MPIRLYEKFKSIYFAENHFHDLGERYRSSRYNLSIHIEVDKYIDLADRKQNTSNNIDTKRKKDPLFYSITVECSNKKTRIFNLDKEKDIPAEELRKGCIDIKHTGELIFLLALKLKYDSLSEKYSEQKQEQKLDYDNSGLLHTDEIFNLYKKGFTEVHRTIWRNIRYKLTQNILNDFTFLSELSQLYHLVGYLGNIGQTGSDPSIFIWLNVSPENIKFFNGTEHEIKDAKLYNILKPVLDGCFLKPNELNTLYEQMAIGKNLLKYENKIGQSAFQAKMVRNQPSSPAQSVVEASPQTFNKPKYFCNMRDVLMWNDETESAQWFRKSCPIAADFRAGYVYEKKDLLKKIDELVTINKISILEGDGGTGKSVLIRNFVYNLLKEDETRLIYHYSFKTDSQIVDFHDFLSILNDLTCIVIIEDIHLATQDIQFIVDSLSKKNGCRLLLTARPSFRETLVGHYSDKLKDLPRLILAGSETADEIINFYIKNCKESKILWTEDIKHALLKVSEGNLWLLSYALRGCSGKGDPISWIKDGVVQDLQDLKNHNSYKCNPEILLALSPLYMKEVLTAQSFLVKELGYERKEIDKLVSLGEVIKHKIDEGIFYGLPHSSLALAYWRYGDEYRNYLEYSVYEDFIYNYAISGVSNGLTAIRTSGADVASRIYKRVAAEDKAKDIFVTQTDRTIFMGYVERLFHCPLMEPKTYYYSESVLLFLGHCLLKRNYVSELSRLLHLSSFNRKQFWIELDKDILENVLYDNSQLLDDSCYCIEILYNCPDLRPSIKNFLQPQKIALLANKLDDPFMILHSLHNLLRADIDFAIDYWNSLDKDKLQHMLKKKHYDYPSSSHPAYCSVIDIFKAAKDIELDTSKLCCATLAQKARLKVLLKNILCTLTPALTTPDVVATTMQIMHDARTIDQTLNELSQITPDLALVYWKVLDKNKLKKNFGNIENSDYLHSLATYHEQIRLDICAFIEETFIPYAHKYRDIRGVSEAVKHFFDIDKNIGLKFWEQIDKNIFIEKLSRCKPNNYLDCISSILDSDKAFAKDFWKDYVNKEVLDDKIQIANLDCIADFISPLWRINADYARILCNKFGKLWLQELSDEKGICYRVENLLCFCQVKSTSYTVAFVEKLLDSIDEYAEEFMSLKSIEDVVEHPCFMANVAPSAAVKFYEYIFKKYGIEAFIKQHRYSKHGWYMVPDCQRFLSMADPEDKQGWRQFFNNINQDSPKA